MSSESNIIDAEAADASILDELGVAEEVLGLVDPVAFLRSILGTLLKACSHPIELAGAGANLAFGAIAAAPVVVGRAAGPRAGCGVRSVAHPAESGRHP